MYNEVFMPKKRSAKHREKAWAQARYEARKLAREEGLREQGARLVGERSGDPRSIRRRQTVDGRTNALWNAETESGRHVSDALKRQLESFHHKSGSADPIFFDPDADEPAPLSEARHKTVLTEAATQAAESGADPSLIPDHRDLGYPMTAENQRLVEELLAWYEALQAYWDDDDDDEDFDDDGYDILDDEYDIEELSDDNIRKTEQIIATMLTDLKQAPPDHGDRGC
ncbi:hypothetical protein [Rhizohabitans arisaemae]|uniref:hypothetical protein n=1 Tax=Rhizohabitans arisaemae TaxID=2720610 RepID=UPI0024B0BECC|nr:hypothetical protein [Rhizohabitans arisaemae]